MSKNGKIKLNSLVGSEHLPFPLSKNQIKLMSKKQRFRYYARLDGDADKQILQLKLMSNKQRIEFYARLDEKANKTKVRAALHDRVFIKTVLKKGREKFYKNLNKKLKKDFLRDNTDRQNDVQNE